MQNCEPTGSTAQIAVGGVALLGWIALFCLYGVGTGQGLHCHCMPTFAPFTPQRGNSWLDSSLFFLLGWILMTVAMMLPTIFPQVEHFRRFTDSRGDGARFAVLLVAGYLLIWILFGICLIGVVALAGASSSSLLRSQAVDRFFAPGLFILAGGFQLLPFKRCCLEKCRSSLNLAAEVWEQRNKAGVSVLLGLRQGIACVGSCGMPMLLMFAVESAHLPWMLVLAAAMVAEKNASWGPRLSRPIGIFFLACAALILARSEGSII